MNRILKYNKFGILITDRNGDPDLVVRWGGIEKATAQIGFIQLALYSGEEFGVESANSAGLIQEIWERGGALYGGTE